MSGISAVALSPADVTAAGGVLARAFHDDPLLGYVLPDPIKRAHLAPGHFALVLEYGLRFGTVLTTPGEPSGAAVWLGRGEAIVTDERAVEGGLTRLPAVIGVDAADRFLSVLAALDPCHRSDVPTDHWYLSVLGVDPAAQGLGVARALLEPVMSDADRTGLPCYLETAEPANVGFYEHLGFYVLRDFIEESSGLRLWTFRRDP